MFVVQRISAAAEIRDQDEIDRVVDSLSGSGYRAALRSMVAAGGEAATLANGTLGVEALVNRESRFRSGVPRIDAPVGDVLFTVSGEIADRCYFLQPLTNRLNVSEVRHHGVPSDVAAFCGAVEKAIRSRLDGRRVRGMNFNWRAVRNPVARHVPSSPRRIDTGLKTKKPDYSPGELPAAQLLNDAETRDLLIQLAQIGKVRAADAKLSPALIQQLHKEHLLSKEYLVLCRKDSRTLCQVSSMEHLRDGAGGKLVCATCGRRFSEEVVQEIFAATETSKRLTSGSRWMMIWLTELLIQAGLSKEGIMWSATSGDDEIDIMTDELGSRVMFELKDREFGLGDAYPFAYRLDRYDGDFGVVVSTDRIAEEAEKFFNEQRSRSYIQTLVGKGIEGGVRDLVDRYSRFGVLRTLTADAAPVGISVAPLVGKWMDMFALAIQRGKYKPPLSQSAAAGDAAVAQLAAGEEDIEP